MPNDDDVGYGRPPKHAQFKSGQSGNPRGRVKGRKNYHTRFHDIMNETVIVHEKGRRKRMSKFDVFVSQMINKAIAGDPQALKVLRDWYRVFAYSDDKREPLTIIFSPEDAKY